MSKTKRDTEASAKKAAQRATVQRLARIVCLCNELASLCEEATAHAAESRRALPGFVGDEQQIVEDLIFLQRAVELINIEDAGGLDLRVEIETTRVTFARVA